MLENQSRTAVSLLGLVLLAHHFVLYRFSDQFIYEGGLLHMPILLFVLFQVLAGCLFLTLFWLIPRLEPTTKLLLAMLGVGLLMRLLLFDSTPILEVDFYRYLWDGAMVAHGQNPYELAPEQVLSVNDQPIRELVLEAGPIFDRINYPELTTIYPPMAQLGFAISYWIEPWSFTAWRSLLLIFDLITVALLLLMLRGINRSPLWAMMYWWNPLVTKEMFNSMHMDGLLLPFVLTAVLFLTLGWKYRASIVLAMATAIKIWPLILLPFIVLSERRRLEHACGLIVIFAVVSGVLLTPFLLYTWNESSGLLTYSWSWETNDALFRVIHYVIGQLFSVLSIELVKPAEAARMLVALTLVVLAFWMSRKPDIDAEEMYCRLTILIAVMFMLSPTQYPWYYLWLAPFLVLYPVFALFALTALLPIYYLRFYFHARGQMILFEQVIVWFEYLPVLGLLLAEWILNRQTARSAYSNNAARKTDPAQSGLAEPGHV